MADNKYRKDLDRQAVLFDKQNRIIDLTDFVPALPDVGIYDEPVRYFAANEQWCKLIFGWLTFMQEEGFWPDAEGQDYAGIQAILTFEEGIDMSIDYDALKAAIRDGMYSTVNDVAKQIVSGRTTDIAVGSDGTVSDPTTGSATDEAPADDPTTTIDEEQSAIFGGTTSLCRGIELYLDKIDTLYGATNGTPTTTEQDAEVILALYFDLDPTLLSSSLTAYYSYRASNPRILFDVLNTMFQFMYCHGSNERAFGKWLVDLSAYSATKLFVVKNLVAALNDSFWTDYFNSGLNKPNTLYLDASCVPSPTEIMNMVTLGSTYTTQTVWKNSHRLLVTVENYFTDSVDSDILDFWWYKTTAGTPVSRISSVTMQLGTGVSKPTTNQVPYSTTHKYQFTVDTPAAAGVLQLTVSAANITTPVASASGVGFKVTVQDLGEYVV